MRGGLFGFGRFGGGGRGGRGGVWVCRRGGGGFAGEALRGVRGFNPQLDSNTCTTGAQHRTLKERPILSGYRWQF